jgi:hypothetical protein
MTNQMSTQEIIKKDFINIFEISHLLDVSGITARRYINGILEEIELLKSQIKLDTQDDKALSNQRLNTLLSKARRRVIGQTKAGEDIFILELAREEALAKWGLRPAAKADIKKIQDMTAQAPVQPAAQPDIQASSQIYQEDIRKTEDKTGEVAIDTFGSKYISLLESQLTEKDNTIKDLRETNKFLSITNGKLNEQLKFLLEKPKESDLPRENFRENQ